MATKRLSIPPEFRSGIELLATLSKEQVEALLLVLREKPEPQSSQATKKAAKKLRGISPSELKAVFSSLKTLYNVKASSKIPREDFAQDLIKALIRVRPQSLTDVQIPDAISNVEKLLSIDSLELGQKRSRVEHDTERRFCNFRLLVDLQPIFTGEDEEVLRELIVNFRIKIGYHLEGNQHKDMYLSLSREDITSIREALDRAEEQARTLEIQLKGFRIGDRDVL